MSALAAIDSLEFARAEQELSGSLPVTGLKRLHDCLHDVTGQIDYQIRGGRDERGLPQLQVHITGSLQLQCQRCLGQLDYSVDVRNTLLVVTRGAAQAEDIEDPEAPDSIESDPELVVADLIEDELLLSLPLSPRHAEGACASRLHELTGDGRQESAFARLAALKDIGKKR
jgi:uncharacterized protein